MKYQVSENNFWSLKFLIKVTLAKYLIFLITSLQTSSTPLNSELFQQMHIDPRNQNSVLRSLGKLYGKEFMLIGILKFIADSSGFLSPILLNWVVQFMEDKSMDIRLGYLYALGLAGSAFTAALCNTHFNLLISELKLKVGIALIIEEVPIKC